jgi:FMN-dependent NADH-azoreductase
VAYFPFQSLQLIIERSVDLIVQPGYLFAWTNAGGSIGLVQGKKMVCLAANFE